MEVSKTLINQLYNKEFKKIFLEEYLTEDNTREMYVLSLMKTAKYEEKLDKDLCLFSKKEVLKMFVDLNIESHTSIRTLFATCRKYVGWTCGTTFNKSYNNPFYNIDFDRDIFKLVNFRALKDKYITEEQLWDIVDKHSLNAQDSICLLLPFYGVKADKCLDLIKLKIENINKVKSIVMVGNRDVRVPKKVIDITIMANKETIYNRRGNVGYGDRTTCSLINSEFIIRPADGKEGDTISAQSISSRCKKLLVEAGYKTTSINDVNISGKLHLLRQIMTKEGYVIVGDYQDVNERFGHSTSNYSNIKKLFETLCDSGKFDMDKIIFDEIEDNKNNDKDANKMKATNTKSSYNSRNSKELITTKFPNVKKYIILLRRLIAKNNMLKIGLAKEEDIEKLEMEMKKLRSTLSKEELQDIYLIDRR